MKAILCRRLLIMAAPLALASTARAQSASRFAGRWTGHVKGLGDAEIVVISVRANGQVDGKMEFSGRNTTFLFGDKLDIPNGISHAVIRGSTLTIETSMGAIYRLNLVNGQLNGEYIRGSTDKVPVTFRKTT
jgi:hypothetical protein